MVALVLDIVTTAAILYIVAAGLLLVFGVMKIINFAHGALLTVGSYAAVIASQLGLSPWVALPGAALAGALTGIIIERFVVRPLYARPLDAILATWGLGIVIGQILTIVFGRGIRFAEPPLTGVVSLIGVDYSVYRLALIGVALVLGLCISALLARTRLGLETRAVIMNEDLARGLESTVALYGSSPSPSVRPWRQPQECWSRRSPVSIRTWVCPGWSTPSCLSSSPARR